MTTRRDKGVRRRQPTDDPLTRHLVLPERCETRRQARDLVNRPNTRPPDIYSGFPTRPAAELLTELGRLNRQADRLLDHLENL